jgi:hypothetical protein
MKQFKSSAPAWLPKKLAAISLYQLYRLGCTDGRNLIKQMARDFGVPVMGGSLSLLDIARWATHTKNRMRAAEVATSDNFSDWCTCNVCKSALKKRILEGAEGAIHWVMQQVHAPVSMVKFDGRNVVAFVKSQAEEYRTHYGNKS